MHADPDILLLQELSESYQAREYAVMAIQRSPSYVSTACIACHRYLERRALADR